MIIHGKRSRYAFLSLIAGISLGAMPAFGQSGGVVFGFLMADYGENKLCVAAAPESGAAVKSYECPSGETLWSVSSAANPSSMQIALGAGGPGAGEYCLGVTEKNQELVVYECEGEHKARTLWVSSFPNELSTLQFYDNQEKCASALYGGGGHVFLANCAEATQWLFGGGGPESGSSKQN